MPTGCAVAQGQQGPESLSVAIRTLKTLVFREFGESSREAAGSLNGVDGSM